VAGISLEPLRTTEAHAYWRAFLEGRSDVPTRDLKDHVERYLALPPEEQRSHYAFVRDRRIVGTVRLSPDGITGFSMAEGHAADATPAILKAVDALRAQGATSITASYEDRYGPAFEALGFRPSFARMRMEAPTQRFPPRPDVLLKPPEESEIVGLTGFFKAVYEGHIEQQYGIHVGSDEEWREYIAGLLKGDSGRFLPQASFVSMEGESIVGGILVTHWMGMPLIAELGVAMDRRGRGLGRALLETASSRLAGMGEPRWSLYVTAGNDPAIRLYGSMDFATVGGRAVTARLAAPG